MYPHLSITEFSTIKTVPQKLQSHAWIGHHVLALAQQSAVRSELTDAIKANKQNGIKKLSRRIHLSFEVNLVFILRALIIQPKNGTFAT